MKQEYDASLIAKYILFYTDNLDLKITNMKLQKLLYFTQNQLLKNTNSYIIEDFEAWGYGPVIPTVYLEYSMYGGSYINNIYYDDEFKQIKEMDKNIINEIVETNANKNVWNLVDISRIQGNSWDKIYSKEGFRGIISKESIAKDNIDCEILSKEDNLYETDKFSYIL